MMNLRNFILSIFGLILLANCSDSSERKRSTKTSMPTKSGQLESIEVGSWKYENTIWYSSGLTLHDNGTFIFHNQTCNGQAFTEGLWSNDKGTVLLSSFDKYKMPKEVNEDQLIKTKDAHKATSGTKKSKLQFSFLGFKKSPLTINYTSSDTINVYFDKVPLN